MRRLRKNQSGFTLIELMISAMIAILLMGAAISVFTKERKLVETQVDKANVRGAGRQAMIELAKEIRRAGMGFPQGTGLIQAASDEIEFYVNKDGVSTTITADTTANTSPTVTVGDTTGFSAGDNVVIFDTQAVTVSASTWEMKTINSVNAAAKTITFNSNVTNAYLAQSGILMSKYHTMHYEYDPASQNLYQSEDGGSNIPVLNDIVSFTFTYSDKAGATTATLANMRKVQIDVTVRESTKSDTQVAFKTDVNLRNLGK